MLWLWFCFDLLLSLLSLLLFSPVDLDPGVACLRFLLDFFCVLVFYYFFSDYLRPPSVVSFQALHSQVNWSRLSSAGFRAVLLDKDNTITMPYEKELHSSVESALKDALAVFGRHNVAIISNSAVRLGE